MNPESFELQLTTEANSQAIRNLWPLYLHDISEYDGNVANPHGVITPDDSIETLGDAQLTPGSAWWTTPSQLFPYLGTVDGRPAGFNLIASGPYVPTPEIDFVVYEFFLAKPYRGTSVAFEMARQGIARHPGTWEVVTYPNAPQAIRFWRKALPLCAQDGAVVETEEDHPFGRKVVFRFLVGSPA